MRRFISALIIGGVFAIGVPGFTPSGVTKRFNCIQTRDARADDARPDISDCMSFRNDTKDKSIVVQAKNECHRKLSCSLSYSVRCEDNHGKRTSSSAESAHFALASDASTELVLSAERCKQAWTIDDVAWRCE